MLNHSGTHGVADRRGIRSEFEIRRERQMDLHREADVMNKAALLVVCGVMAGSGLSRTLVTRTIASPGGEQAPDGAAVYKSACAQCHDQPQARTPSRDALNDRTADAVLQSLTSGSMAVPAMALSVAEKRAVAEYVTGKAPAATRETAGMCAARTPMPADIASSPQWNGGGLDLANSRYQPSPGLAAADVPKLTLKWAFGFPGGTQAYGQPAIVGGHVFVGSDTGRFYVLDAASGCIQWSFQADGGIRAAPSVGPLEPGTAGRYAVYFGDVKGSVYA